VSIAIAKGRGHRAEGRREKIEGLRFQYLARVLIALATAITIRIKVLSRKAYQQYPSYN
jgi:hypothetical protein